VFIRDPHGRCEVTVAAAAPPPMAGTLLLDDGLLPWLAPETGRVPVDAHADVYSLGAMLYFALTGTPPRAPRHNASTLPLAQSQLPPDLSRADARLVQQLDDVLARCLQFVPRSRYPWAGALAEALEPLAASC
jgi:serine/threonine protein kinase